MLAYGAEVVVPLKITHGSRVESYEPETNEEDMRLALDLIDEVSAPILDEKYSIEELLLVMQPQEALSVVKDLHGQRVSSFGDFGVSCTLHPKAWDLLSYNLVGAPYPGDKYAYNIWGEPRLYLSPRTGEIAGSGGLSSAGEISYPRSLEAVDESWAFVVGPHRRTFLKLVEDGF
ncbi:hypothetical protein AgCh_032216 [Apium graveolens]